MVEDNEELGGDVRAANLRALRRTLALQLDENADEDGGNGEDREDDSDDDDETGEVLSEAEVRRLTANRRGEAPGRALVEDFDKVNREDSSDEAEDMLAVAKAARKKAAALGEDQYTTEELFQSLSNRKPFLTLSDIKKWDYARLLMQDGDLTMPVLQSVFQRAGAVRGQLGPEQFGLFLDLFAAELGLAEDDGSFIDDEEEALLAPGSIANPEKGPATTNSNRKQKFVIDDFAEVVGSTAAVATSTSTAKHNNQKQDNKPAPEFIQLPDGLSVGVSDPATSAPPRAMQTLSDALFETFAQGKAHVDFETLVQKWDTLRLLIARDAGNAVRLRQSFTECANGSKVKGQVDAAGFAKFVDSGVSSALTAMQVGLFMSNCPFTPMHVERNRCYRIISSRLLERINVYHCLKTIYHVPLFSVLLSRQQAADSAGKSSKVHTAPSASTPPAAINEAEEDDFEEISVDEAFLELSENGDGEFVTQEAVARWPLVADLLSEGYLQHEEFARMFQQASLKNAASTESEEGGREGGDAVASGVAEETVLDYDGFNALLDLLDPFASDDVDASAGLQSEDKKVWFEVHIEVRGADTNVSTCFSRRFF
jgi:hypothetical protein